jgi:hypothetical protein
MINKNSRIHQITRDHNLRVKLLATHELTG